MTVRSTKSSPHDRKLSRRHLATTADMLVSHCLRRLGTQASRISDFSSSLGAQEARLFLDSFAALALALALALAFDAAEADEARLTNKQLTNGPPLGHTGAPKNGDEKTPMGGATNAHNADEASQDTMPATTLQQAWYAIGCARPTKRTKGQVALQCLSVGAEASSHDMGPAVALSANPSRGGSTKAEQACQQLKHAPCDADANLGGNPANLSATQCSDRAPSENCTYQSETLARDSGRKPCR